MADDGEKSGRPADRVDLGGEREPLASRSHSRNGRDRTIGKSGAAASFRHSPKLAVGSATPPAAAPARAGFSVDERERERTERAERDHAHHRQRGAVEHQADDDDDDPDASICSAPPSAEAMPAIGPCSSKESIMVDGHDEAEASEGGERAASSARAGCRVPPAVTASSTSAKKA